MRRKADWRAEGAARSGASNERSLSGHSLQLRAPIQEGLAFRSKGSIGVVADRAASARDSTAPSALTDPGLVLVRPGLPGPLGREEGLDHECQTY
jgi:hypothetical protein